MANQVIIEKKDYLTGHTEVITTYVNDEYLVHSALLCLVSVASFYPVVVFLNKQQGFKMGKRMFDQMILYAIMLSTLCHFMSE